MTIDGINVQHGKLDAGSADVLTAANAIRARLNALEDDLKPLASDWTGAAKQSYEQARTTWDRAIDDMVQLLRAASSNVATSNDEYRAADARGADRF